MVKYALLFCFLFVGSFSTPTFIIEPKLKTGQTASVVEILGNHEAYIVDVDLVDDYETITVLNEQIAEVIS